MKSFIFKVRLLCFNKNYESFSPNRSHMSWIFEFHWLSHKRAVFVYKTIHSWFLSTLGVLGQFYFLKRFGASSYITDDIDRTFLLDMLFIHSRSAFFDCRISFYQRKMFLLAWKGINGDCNTEFEHMLKSNVIYVSSDDLKQWVDLRSFVSKCPWYHWEKEGSGLSLLPCVHLRFHLLEGHINILRYLSKQTNDH